MTIEEKLEFYDIFKQCFDETFPGDKQLYKSVIRLFFNNEKELASDINRLDFDAVARKIGNGVKANYKRWIGKITEGMIDSETSSHASSHLLITCSLVDRFMNKYKKMEFDGETVFIPLREDSVIVDNVIIDVKIADETGRFKIINNHDIETDTEIDLFTFLYGGQISIIYLDQNILTIDLPEYSTRDQHYLCIKGKGLPFTDESETEIVPGKNQIRYGDLYVRFQILNTDKLKPYIKQLLTRLLS